MSPNLHALLTAAALALAPPEKLPLSAWSDRYRRLSPEASAAHGQWTTAPYQREPLDCCGHASPFEKVVLMWGSQLGKTEVILCKVAETIAECPGPMLMVQPTLAMAETVSKDRIAPMLRDTPALKGKIAEQRGRDAASGIFSKRFIGGQLSLVGSNSPAGLASRPIRDLFLDEVDRYEESAGAEGDPISLSIVRTTTFWNRKIILSSSPTIKGKSKIAAAFDLSDKRFYFVRCPECGHEQRLVWARVEWADENPEAAFYRCEKCEGVIEHHHKGRMIAGGRWIASEPGSGKAAGFHISSLYSPFVSWGQLAVEWLAAQGNPEQLRTFINTRLAELWDDEATGSISEEQLLARRENYGPVLPPEVALITAGVDVQANRIEVSFYGWGRGEESWLLEHRVIPGDTTGEEVWEGLDAALLKRWTHPVAGVGELPVKAACVDSGYLTERVTRFCEARRGRAVWAIKGEDGPKPMWPRRESKARRGIVFVVGVDSGKSILSGRLKITEGPGRIHFPALSNIDLEFFEQMNSEFVVTTYRRGRPVRVWQRKKARRAEAWDAANYSLIALAGLRAHGFHLENEVAMIDDLRQVNTVPVTQAAAATQERRPSWFGDRRTNWFNR